MKNNEKQYYIYLRSTKERVPCTKKEFDDYYRDINVYRQKQQRQGRCVCPEGKRLDCDMDCLTCPFKRVGNLRSLDYALPFDEEQTAWIDFLDDSSPLMDEVLSDSIYFKSILKRLIELMPQAIEIGELRQAGLSDRDISKEIGIPRKTFEYRLARLKKNLEKEFFEIF